MTKKGEYNEQWVSVLKFMEHYDLSSSAAYRLIHAKEFPALRVSKRAYRVDLSRTDEYFKKHFN